MMIDSQFETDFQLYLENEFKDLSERLISNRHQSLQDVYEIQGRIRMIRALGQKFKEMSNVIRGITHAS